MISTFHRAGAGLLIATVAGLSGGNGSLAVAAVPQTAATVVPADPKPAREVLGVYVGIGAYTDPTVSYLTVQRTNHDVLLPLLSDRFGVRWTATVMDEDATRAGIAAALEDLLAQTRAAVARGSDVTTVFFYTGHGSQVRDQDGDEEDGRDETLVTVNSSIEEGADDIRDDDLAAFRAAIADAGAEFVMIVEACHSESTFRGPPSLSLTRSGVGPGPNEPLLPGLAEFYLPATSQPGGADALSKLLDGSDSERFICLSAVQDEFPALTMEEDGRQWGRFSRSLVTAIESMQPGDSYRTLHRRLVADFDARFPGARQRPILHPQRAAVDHRDVPFLGGRFRSAHARVRVTADGRASLDAGIARGYATGARVSIFRSIDALEAWEQSEGRDGAPQPIAEAWVTDATFDTAVLDASGPIPPDSVARITTPASPPVAVYLTATVDPRIRDAVNVLPGIPGVVFTEDIMAAVFIIDQREDGSLAIIDAEDADLSADKHGRNGASPANPGPSRRIIPSKSDAASIARAMLVDLEFLSTTRQFWALSGDESEVGLRIVRRNGEPLRLSRNGLAECTSGEAVSIIVTNHADEPRSITLFQSIQIGDEIGAFEQIDISSFLPGFPEQLRFDPGESITIQGSLSLDAAGLSHELVRFKAISTSEPVDLRAFLQDPATRPARTRSAPPSDPLSRMVVQSVHRTRSSLSEPPTWSARNQLILITAQDETAEAAKPGQSGPPAVPGTVDSSRDSDV